MRRKPWLFVIFGLFLGLATSARAQEELLHLADSLAQTSQAEVAADLYRLVLQRYPHTYWAQRARIGLLRYTLQGTARKQALRTLETLLRSPGLPELAPLLKPLLAEDSSEVFLRYRLLLARRVPTLEGRESWLLEIAAGGPPALAQTAWRTLAADYETLRVKAQIQLAGLLASRDTALARLLLRRHAQNPDARLLLARMALPGDTLEALAQLREPNSRALRRLKARLLLALDDAEGAAQTLAEDPDTLPGLADLKARAWMAIGLRARLEDLLPYLQNPLVRARVLLVLGRDSRALALLDSLETAGLPDSAVLDETLAPTRLRLEALLNLGRFAEAAALFLRRPTDRAQGYDLARALDSLGLAPLALQVIQVAETLRPGPRFVPREALLRLRARLKPLPGLMDTLRRLGISVPPAVPDSAREAVLVDMARGLPLLEGARRLLDLRDPWTVIRLLSGLKLNETGNRLLAQAYLEAYELSGDSTYALQAEALFQARKVQDPTLYLRLHRRFRPRVLLHLDTLKVDRRAPPYLVEGLLAAGRPDLALQVARRSRLRDRAIRFRLFLANHLLDSAYAALDFGHPLEVVALAETLAAQNAGELAYDLLKRVSYAGFQVGQQAAHLRLRLAARLARWPEVVDLARAYLTEYPPSDTVRLLLARGLLETGHPRKAYLRAVPLRGTEARRIQGLALLRAGYPDWAATYRDAAPELAFRYLLDQKDVLSLLPLPLPRDSALIHRYLVLLATTGHEDFARKLADSVAAAGLLPASVARLALVEAEVRQGQVLQARQDLRRIHEPDARARAWYALGLYWMRQQDFQKAKEAFFKVIQWGGPETRGLGAFKLATVLFQERRYREAVEYYRMATELLSRNPQTVAEAYHNIAVCLKRLKDLEGARQAYQTLIQRFPGREEALDARISLALVDIDLGKPAEGYAVLAEAEGLMPRFRQEAEVQYWLGTLARMQGQQARALGHFGRVYTFHDTDAQWAPLARYEAALILEQAGLADRARLLFQQVLQQLAPTDPLYQEVQKHLKP